MDRHIEYAAKREAETCGQDYSDARTQAMYYQSAWRIIQAYLESLSHEMTTEKGLN